MAEENNDNQYVVLARKYRPQTFDDLLGQDALVQTLTNAIKNNRLHHAYILTGIRGVGKTTTARIIARALNCTGKDGHGGPTVKPCGICENCKAIAADRHIDVIELDAASRTGVDDIREILDGVRYKPTNARYKIYIIDEVHMLSKNAFNALLKTLEEPPSHVKFIFATTEIRKVPVTILSRCQRFDLQRLSIDTLFNHFKNIIAKEGLTAEDEALRLIAKAADGSCRDGLSLLDQAISLSPGNVKTEVVKNMIGLADRARTFELFKHLVSGETTEVVNNLTAQYKDGANPMSLLQDLIATTHLLAKTKIIPSFIEDDSLSETEKNLCRELAPQLPIAILSKIWQMMIKGLSELTLAPVQIDALEMILIRIAYSASLPTPQEILADVKKNSKLTPLPATAGVPHAVSNVVPASIPPKQEKSASPAKTFATFDDLIAALEQNRQMLLVYSLKNDVSVSSFSHGQMTMTVSERIAGDFIMNLHKVLTEITGVSWKINIERGQLGETVAAREQAKVEADKRSISEDPLVKAILSEFKGAKIETITRKILEEEGSFAPENNDDNETYFEEEL